MIINDPILLGILLLIEEKGASGIPITVNVHGFMVTGILCTREEYMLEAQAHAAGMSFNLGDCVKALHEWVQSCEVVDKAKGEQAEHRLDFIHLKNAQFLSTAFYFPAERNLPWRAKTSAIDGWSLGLIDVQ